MAKAAKKGNYLSMKDSNKIAKENRKITRELEKIRTRKNIPEEEYVTKMKNPDNIVEFDNVHTYFYTDAGVAKAVNGVSFDVPKGKTIGIVGESGCGKSVTSLSLLQLLQRPSGQVVEGAIRFDAGDKVYDVTKMPLNMMCDIRGNDEDVYIKMNGKEREKFELFLISNSDVEANRDFLETIVQINIAYS